jgi:GNAT superfamily N-acetyltransferase
MNQFPRPSAPEDTEEMKSLWALCFGDAEEFIDLFFTALYRPGMAAVYMAEGCLAAMAFAIPGFILHEPGLPDRTVAYLYGVSTHPSHRGRGYGAAVSRAAAEQADCDITALLPASEALSRWYAKDMDARCFNRIREEHFQRTEPFAHGTGLRRLDPAEYLARREALLSGHPHVEPPLDFLSLAGTELSRSGGGLFAWRGGICAAELNGDTVLAKELLPAGGAADAAAELLDFLPAEKLTARLPASHGGESVGFMMALPCAPVTASPSEIHWGLALD